MLHRICCRTSRVTSGPHYVSHCTLNTWQ